MARRLTLQLLVGGLALLVASTAVAQQGGKGKKGKKQVKTLADREAQEEADKTKALEDKVRTLESAIEKQVRTIAEQRAKALEKNAKSIMVLSDKLDVQQEELEEVKGELEETQTRLDAIEAEIFEEETGDDEYPFELQWSGFVRTEYEIIGDDTERTDFVGLNDGFIQTNARLTLDGTYRVIGFRLQLDTAVANARDRNTADFDVRTEGLDSYLHLAPSRYLQLVLGRFKPPFDQESLRETASMPFVERAVESVGVSGVEGVNVSGLGGPRREVGLMLRSERLMNDTERFGMGYALSVTNGNPSNNLLNDNDDPAYYGRFELYYKDWITLGVAGFYNRRTTNQTPDLIDEEDLGLAVDLIADAYNVLVGLQYMQVTTSFPDVDVEADRTASGYHAYLGYRLPFGVIPVIRAAFFDPTSNFESSDPVLNAQLLTDDLTYGTLGMSWDVPGYPLLFQANYTVTIEDDERVLDNDKVEFLGQVRF